MKSHTLLNKYTIYLLIKKINGVLYQEKCNFASFEDDGDKRWTIRLPTTHGRP
jgi:hypothetical protein